MRAPGFICLAAALALGGRAAAQGIVVKTDRGPSYTFKRSIGGLKTDMTPHIAVWIEDARGNFFRTVYVSLKGGKQDIWVGKRPHPLPVWEKKHSGEKFADGATGASPAAKAPLPLSWRIAVPPSMSAAGYTVWLEVNIGFDYNEVWPDDGKDLWGQPSLLYRTAVPGGAPSGASYPLEAVGVSRAGGGEWIEGIAGLTSALGILKSPSVRVE
jgi:hypothetical protein